MAKKWAEVQATPGYQALAPEAKEAARQQYFQQVITPQVPAERLAAAKTQFDSETAEKAQETPPEETWGGAIKNVAEAAAHGATEFTGGTLANLGGLGALGAAAIGDAVSGKPGGSGIDPTAVRDKLREKLVYRPSDPESTANQLVELPGKVIGGAGEGLANVTGLADVPLVGDIVRQIPAALVAGAGVRAPEPGAMPPVRPTIAGPKKLATPAELHQNAVDTLLKNDVQLATEQRGTGTANKQAGSIGRAGDAVIGKSNLARQQLQDFTRAVFRKVGLKAENATPDAMAELLRSTRDKYQAAHARSPVPIDPQLATDLSDIASRSRRNPAVETKFDKLLEHIRASSEASPTGPRISSKNAEEIRHELSLIEGASDSNIRSVATEVKNALDEAAARSATPAEATAMRDARKQYHFMRQIEGAVDQKGGFISPKKLLNSINNKRNKNEAVYGMGDQELVELARAGAKVLPDTIGDSGTATRVTDIAKTVLALGHPVTAAKVVGATLGGRLLNEANAARGTAGQIAAQTAKRVKGSDPTITAARVAVAQSSRETEEQKKRRLKAEALAGE